MVLQRNDPRLFWSVSGEVACSTHAPRPTSEAWKQQGWRAMTTDEQAMFAELARKGAAPPPSCDACDAGDQRG